MSLKKARAEGKLEKLESLYLELKPALIQAGRFYRKESLKELGLGWLKENIAQIEKYLGQKLGPQTKDEKKHAKLVAKIIRHFKKGQTSQSCITQAAILRHGLG